MLLGTGLTVRAKEEPGIVDPGFMTSHFLLRHVRVSIHVSQNIFFLRCFARMQVEVSRDRIALWIVGITSNLFVRQPSEKANK